MDDKHAQWRKGVKLLLDAAVTVEDQAVAQSPTTELGQAVVPHGAHPRNARLVEYRRVYFGYNLPLAKSDTHDPKWGYWTSVSCTIGW